MLVLIVWFGYVLWRVASKITRLCYFLMFTNNFESFHVVRNISYIMLFGEKICLTVAIIKPDTSINNVAIKAKNT